MPYDYFISYSQHDRAFARRLVDELGRHGARGFMDQVDISSGAAMGVGLRAAIEGSDAMVVIVSPEATKSNYVLAEIGMAQALDKRIIPILVPGAGFDDAVSSLLGGYAMLDAGRLPVEETSARIVAAIRGIPVHDARRLLPAARRRRTVLWVISITVLVALLMIIFQRLVT